MANGFVRDAVTGAGLVGAPIDVSSLRVMGRPWVPNKQITQTPRRERAARLDLPPIRA